MKLVPVAEAIGRVVLMLPDAGRKVGRSEVTPMYKVPRGRLQSR